MHCQVNIMNWDDGGPMDLEIWMELCESDELYFKASPVVKYPSRAGAPVP